MLLEEGDLGDDRLLRELNAMLRAKVTKYYKDESLGDHTDNGTRMRAVELLAELRGRRTSEVNLHTDLIEIIPPPRPEEQPVDEG